MPMSDADAPRLESPPGGVMFFGIAMGRATAGWRGAGCAAGAAADGGTLASKLAIAPDGARPLTNRVPRLAEFFEVVNWGKPNCLIAAALRFWTHQSLARVALATIPDDDVSMLMESFLIPRIFLGNPHSPHLASRALASSRVMRIQTACQYHRRFGVFALPI